MNSENSFVILCVIYKTILTESATIKSLLDTNSSLDNFRIVIWDNSPENFKQNLSGIDLFPSESTIYLRSPENRPLSQVYNQVSYENQDKKWFIIFDQDTCIPENYFSNLSEAILSHASTNLFLPEVKEKTRGITVSPGKYFFVKGKYFNNPPKGLIKAKNITAITSGMAISMDYLEAHNFSVFNTKLRLYGIDTDFMLNYCKQQQYLYVLGITLHHGSSVFERESPSKKLWRFRELIYAWRIIHNSSVFRRTGVNLYIVYLSIKYTCIKKSFSYLKIGCSVIYDKK